MNNSNLHIALIIGGLLVIGLTLSNLFSFSGANQTQQSTRSNKINTMSSPTPTPGFTSYQLPTIEDQESYMVLLVGDSMTKALAQYPYQLSVRLNDAYPDKGFIIENYSRGSTSIDKLPELIRANQLSEGVEAEPIIDRDYDILIVESMAYNPLLLESREEELRLQEEYLDQVMYTLTTENPNGVIIFLATIAPSKEYFAQNIENVSPEDRALRAQQRRDFLENFISYAQEHNIPLVNVYQESLQADGTATRKYIRTDDNIHPSQEGIEFIQNRLADFIIEQGYLPR